MAPSGTVSTPEWGYVSNVGAEEFEEASAALDRALLRAIGLPEDVEIRAIENGLYELTEKVKVLVEDFSLEALLVVLPELVIDGAALWDRVEPKLKDKVDRVQFVGAVVRYAYRKNDPDIPYIPEPFETSIEDALLNAVPKLLVKLDDWLENLWKKAFGGSEDAE